jgi:hypothetical protein
MKNFRFDFSKIIDVAEALFFLTEERVIPHTINIKNIQYVVVPEAFRFLNYVKKSILVPNETPENSIVTVDSLNNYMIVPVNGARINIFSDGRWINSINLFVSPQADIVETFGKDYTATVRRHYRSLCEILPFDLTNTSNEALRKKVVYWLHAVTPASTTTLTLIYTLLNFDEKIKVTSYSDPHTATQYIEGLRDRIRSIGNNFFEVIENLYILRFFAV